MPWDWVIGQPRVVDALRHAVATDRVAHAYLFEGPDGSGKRAAALALAQALECERRRSGEGDPCGACTPCRKVARFLHPDVQVHLPQATDADPEETVARLQALAEDLYAEVRPQHRPDLGGKPSGRQVGYTVDRMREIGRSLRLTPVEGRHKVLVVVDADTVNVEGANAFLKDLEEPTSRTTIVLTAERAHRLLPTIVSRCQRLRFDPLPPETIEVALRDRYGLEPARAALLARMADGSLTRALELARNEEIGRRREQVVTFLRLAWSGRTIPLDDLVRDLAAAGREPLKGALLLLLAWVRDLVVLRAAGEDAPILNQDQREALTAFVRNLPQARLEDMAARIEEALALTERNAHPVLVLTVLADALRDAMHGRPRSYLARPLEQDAA